MTIYGSNTPDPPESPSLGFFEVEGTAPQPKKLTPLRKANAETNQQERPLKGNSQTKLVARQVPRGNLSPSEIEARQTKDQHPTSADVGLVTLF